MKVHAMRKLFVMAVLAVVGIAPASAQAANITITKTGFVPTVTIHPGEPTTRRTRCRRPSGRLHEGEPGVAGHAHRADI
jgi:hypothetical protein